jgi:hypothetical protein
MLGVINLGNMSVETPGTVVSRIRRGLPYVAAKDVIVLQIAG